MRTKLDKYGRYSTNTDNSFFALFHLLILLPPERIVQGKIIPSFCLFLWPSSAFFIYNCAKMGSMAQLMRQPKGEGSVPETEERSSLQDGSCLTTARILPKASPLDSKERSALRFSRSQKGRKGRWKSGRRQTDFRGDGRSGLPPRKTTD
ncbi:hypothetical protein [uncultured Desulfovibrio sp.]|uniref:hypothetical protein n=1 Tax=uncultured Desulfovibrio sp. TaxID=167968 RepID=UPI00263AFB15|nr:hypothetical protein [uncultured Desulfovibrio sp.]